MRSEPGVEEIQSYRENGFIVIPGFLDRTALQTWRSVTGKAVDDRMQQLDGPGNQHCDDYYRNVFNQCLRLIDTDPEFSTLMKDPRIGSFAGRLAGAGGIRIWHDQALIKPPYGNPTSWHLDVAYWSFNSRDAISIWIALDDATLENGCLWYLPGTHRSATCDNVAIASNMPELFKCYPEWKEIEAVPVPCPAGSAVFHNGLVAHAAGPNMTPRPRRAVACGFMPDGCTFNGKPNILPEDYLMTLTVGETLTDEHYHPLIWRAADEPKMASR